MTNMSTTIPNASLSANLWGKLQNPALRGAIFKVCSCLCFSAINGVVRYFTLTAKEAGLTPIPAPELAFFETLFGLLLILPWILSSGLSTFKTNNSFVLNLARGCAASMGIILWFTALSKMPIVQVVAFKYAAPVFTILGARLFLGEKCGWARLLAIGTALSGALLITGHELLEGKGDWTEIGLLALLPIGASACYVGSALFAKKQVLKDSPKTVSLYLFFVSLPILAVAASFDWVTPLSWQWPYLIVMGGLLATAYIFLQNAYVIADVTYLVPMSFTRLIAGAAIGMIFFNEWPILWTWVGSFFILIATVSLCKHEVQKVTEKQPSPPLPAAA